jgi:hypothetical protein
MAQFYVNKLENIDWKFAVATASSEINQIGQTFIQIKLTIGGKDTFFGIVYFLNYFFFRIIINSIFCLFSRNGED